MQNPIAMAWDRRGRLWIAENYTYAEPTERFDLRLRDRVLIFEDADGDGRFDRRTVFTDDVQMLASVELGLRRRLAAVPAPAAVRPRPRRRRRPRRSRRGRARRVLRRRRELSHVRQRPASGGPTAGSTGVAGPRRRARSAPRARPTRCGCPSAAGSGGITRMRKRFEVLAHGTTNPWGHDWNALGEAFFINTVNGHLWHMIPGAHFVRPHTIEPNPRAYALIDQHADHWHWDNSKAADLRQQGRARATAGAAAAMPTAA